MVLAGIVSACSTVVQPTGNATVTIATPLTPANGAQIPNAAQPVTLSVTNAVVTETGDVTYTFEVGADSAFTTKVVVKDVAQGSGQTTLKLDTLPGGKDYFWHVRAASGGTLGAFSDTLKFTIGPAIVINAPTPSSPANGTTRFTWPTLTVTNATRSGSPGAISYKFDVSTNTAFTTVLVTATVPETATQTSYTPTIAPPSTKTQYFWRVTAIDQTNNISSAASATQNFTIDPAQSAAAQKAVEEGFVLWPGAQPPGTTGHAKMGDNWQVQYLISHGGTRFLSPLPEALRVFDLLDRGFDPQGAIDWMHANGYPVAGAFYPIGGGVIGFDYIYIGYDAGDGVWNLVLRAEGP
jgi:hypothetical protein